MRESIALQLSLQLPIQNAWTTVQYEEVQNSIFSLSDNIDISQFFQSGLQLFLNQNLYGVLSINNFSSLFQV